MNVDHGKLLNNVIKWALNENAPVEVKVDGIMDVTAWEQQESLTVHLVNCTNPMMKGPYRELLPLGEQSVSIKILSSSVNPKQVKLLVSKKDPEYQYADGFINLKVDGILDHEVIAVDL